MRRSAMACAYKNGFSVEPGWRSASHAIHIGRAAQLARRTDPGQHLASGVVQHHQRAVFYMAATEFAQMGLQGLHGKALQRGAQGGADRGRAESPLGDLLRHMRRNAFAGRIVAPLQRAGHQQVHGFAMGRSVRAGVAGSRLCSTLQARCVTWAGLALGARTSAAAMAASRLSSPWGGFAKQRAAQRVYAHQLAPERHQVQVGLQNLVLAPAALQPLGRYGLPQLLRHAAPAAAALQVLVQQPGQLHGDGGCTAGFVVPQVGPGRGRYGPPVHAAVLVKAFVLAQNQRRA